MSETRQGDEEPRARGDDREVPRAVPRKPGVRCTVCHEAWPVLNDFGRAFRDYGYRKEA